MELFSKEEVKIQRNKIIKYIRINGYRLICGISFLLFGSAAFFTFVGIHYKVTMIVSAMIFIFIALSLALIFSISFVEIFVIKVKKYTDFQVTSTYEKLVNIAKSKSNNNSK
jgi:hypothetical protein